MPTHMQVGEKELWVGRPAKFVRKMSDAEVEAIVDSAEAYAKVAQQHKNTAHPV